jgi:drug/metabolite transporter (DMT)-like permease
VWAPLLEGGMTASRSLWRGRLALLATVIIWSSPPIFQYWLAASFDPWTQNFYRYLAGFLVMAPFFLWMACRAPQRIPAGDWVGCALAALPNVVHQIAQTMAVVLLWPGVYALLGRSSVVFTAVLVMIFFADERWIARSWKFQAGTVLALIGVAGLVWAPGQETSGAETWTGLLLALTAAVAWALYGVLVKKFTRRSGPTLGFGMIGFLTTLLLLPGMLLFGDATALLRADAWTNFVLFASGIISIGLGHWLYYIGIREVGAAPSQSALLLCPLGTMLLSSAFFGETFRFEQMFAGAVLLLGAFLALSAQPPAIEEPA